MHFTAHHHGTDKLGLTRLLQAFANDQWIGEHYTEEQAVEVVMDRFRRLVEAELEIDSMTYGKPQQLSPSRADVYDLYSSTVVTQHSLPERQNILRLFVCLTSLLIGLVVGVITQSVASHRTSKTDIS